MTWGAEAAADRDLSHGKSVLGFEEPLGSFDAQSREMFQGSAIEHLLEADLQAAARLADEERKGFDALQILESFVHQVQATIDRRILMYPDARRFPSNDWPWWDEDGCRDRRHAEQHPIQGLGGGPTKEIRASAHARQGWLGVFAHGGVVIHTQQSEIHGNLDTAATTGLNDHLGPVILHREYASMGR